MEGLEVDCGGEGRHPSAVNLNPLTVRMPNGDTIPRHVDGVCEEMPFADGSVDVLRVESTPLAPGAAAEIARVLRPGGKVILVHPDDYAATHHDAVAAAVGGVRHSHRLGGMTITVIRSVA